MAIDTNNVPYISFTDAFESNHLSVMRYTGTAWGYYAAPGFSDSTATSTSIAINPVTNVPYVSFIDFSKKNKASVVYYNNGWQYAADPNGVSTAVVTSTSLVFNKAGAPYLAYLSQYPFVRTLACPLFDTVKGTAYVDKNYNCTYDAGDAIAPQLKIDAYYYGKQVASTLTDNSGNYLFPFMIKGGKYTIKPDFVPTPYYSSRCGIATGKDTIQTNASMVLNIPLKDTLKQITQIFGPVDGGVSSYVHAMTAYDSVMYVGGYFSTAGNTNANTVVKWDGVKWRKMEASTGFNDDVYSLAVYKQKLFAGGIFTTIEGGTSAGHIAQWNGANWTPVGAGTTGAVEALTVYNGLLYLAGSFGSPYLNIASWNGSAYGTIGGINASIVYDLKVYNGNLYAGGTIVSAGGITTKNIAMWNGTTWDSVSTKGLNKAVLKMCVFQNKLYAGGQFDSAGGKPAAHIACWDGTKWSPLGAGTNGTVMSFGVYNNKLYVGGTFTTAGGIPTSNLAAWDGTAWTGMTSGPSGTSAYVDAICNFDSVLYVGGSFSQCGPTATANIAQWPCAKIIMAGNVFTDVANNCTYTVNKDTNVANMKVLIIDNLKDTNVVYTNSLGNYSDTLSAQMTYTVKLAPPAGLGIKIHCPASKLYTDSAAFNYSMNFGIDTAKQFIDSVAYAIVDTCYADSAERVSYKVYMHTSGYLAGDIITGYLYYGDGTFDTLKIVTAGPALQNISRTLSHIYYKPGTYSCKFKLLSTDVPPDSVSMPVKAPLNCTYVKGKLFFDNNSNCVYNAGTDVLAPNVAIKAVYNSQVVHATSDVNGNFFMAPLHRGFVYSIEMDSTVNPAYFLICATAGKDTVTSLNVSRDIGLGAMTTSLQNLAASVGFACFPNPFTNATNIVFNTDGTHYLELDDLAGRKIESIQCHGKQYELLRKGLPAGMYFIKVYNESQQLIATSKLLIQ